MLQIEILTVGVLSDEGIYRQFGVNTVFSTLASAITYVLLFPINFYVTTGDIKGILFFQLLFLAASIDVISYEIPDWIHAMILLTGCIQLKPQDAVIGLFLVSLPFLLLSCLTKGSIGGGDIKLIAACGFALGASGILIAAAVGMLLSCIGNLPSMVRRDKRGTQYAMAPYLAAGCLFSYLLLC